MSHKQRIPQEEPGLPKWAAVIKTDLPDWQWCGNRLVARGASSTSMPQTKSGTLKKFIVNHVYASHNKDRNVRAAIGMLLESFDMSDEWGMNFGAGETQIHPRLLNLDVINGPTVDIVAPGGILPFRDNALALVISQEVIEHIEDPFAAIGEIHRVLRPGGSFYCQAPFQIGYHPGPTDLWRFTRQAWPVLFPPEHWELEELELSVGHGTGFYRIAVEFVAVTASAVYSGFYKPVKGLAAIFLSPLKLFDFLKPSEQARDRIPGGYFCVARKRTIS